MAVNFSVPDEVKEAFDKTSAIKTRALWSLI
jgi:hypothetical protein